MKHRSIEEILRARRMIATHIQTKGLSEQQTCLFSGMLTALVWASGDSSDTMERLVGGEPIVPGQTAVIPKFRK